MNLKNISNWGTFYYNISIIMTSSRLYPDQHNTPLVRHLCVSSHSPHVWFPSTFREVKFSPATRKRERKKIQQEKHGRNKGQVHFCCFGRVCERPLLWLRGGLSACVLVFPTLPSTSTLTLSSSSTLPAPSSDILLLLASYTDVSPHYPTF